MNMIRLVLLPIAALALNQVAAKDSMMFKQRVDKCAVSPDAEGCSPAVTKPDVDKCAASPDTEGCSPAVTTPDVDKCAVSPDAEGCSPAAMVTKQEIDTCVAGWGECKVGYVYRQPHGDPLCVTPEEARRFQRDTEEADSHRYKRKLADGDWDYECNDGYVFRRAYSGDEVCVTPKVREEVRKQGLSSFRHRTCSDRGVVTKRTGGVVQPE